MFFSFINKIFCIFLYLGLPVLHAQTLDNPQMEKLCNMHACTVSESNACHRQLPYNPSVLYTSKTQQQVEEYLQNNPQRSLQQIQADEKNILEEYAERASNHLMALQQQMITCNAECLELRHDLEIIQLLAAQAELDKERCLEKFKKAHENFQRNNNETYRQEWQKCDEECRQAEKDYNIWSREEDEEIKELDAKKSEKKYLEERILNCQFDCFEVNYQRLMLIYKDYINAKQYPEAINHAQQFVNIFKELAKINSDFLRREKRTADLEERYRICERVLNRDHNSTLKP